MLDICGVVLAGGYSTRMGRDKASLPIHNTTMLQRAILCMEEIPLNTIYISCRSDAPHSAKYPCIYDQHEHIGPIAGIYATLLQTQKPCLFIPVDTPIMKPTLLKMLIDAYSTHTEPKAMFCFISPNGFIESLISLFTPQAIPFLTTAIKEEVYKVTQAIPEEEQYYIDASLYDEYIFYNVNTPQDYTMAEEQMNKR